MYKIVLSDIYKRILIYRIYNSILVYSFINIFVSHITQKFVHVDIIFFLVRNYFNSYLHRGEIFSTIFKNIYHKTKTFNNEICYAKICFKTFGKIMFSQRLNYFYKNPIQKIIIFRKQKYFPLNRCQNVFKCFQNVSKIFFFLISN